MSKTKELDIELQQALLQTWDVIGGDCLRAKFSCEGGTDEYSVTMDKEEVIDVVIDQIRNQGFLRGDALKYWETLTFPEMQDLARTYFKYNTYGW